MSDATPVPKAVRQLVILASALLLASLVISGFNAYATLAAPPQSPYIPPVVGFEGQLANAAGQAVADGNYTITFSLYSQATGGTALWSETQSVAVADGLYSVQLGSVTPLNPTHFEGNRWLGVQVSGDSEMTPRVPISAVPFALNARQAMGLQGYDVASTAPTNGQVLTWDNTSSHWEPDLPGARTFPELAAVGSNEDPQSFFANYRNGVVLKYVSNSAIEASAGELMIDGFMRRNTNAVTIGFTGTPSGPNRGLDTGSAQPNTRYYVYAVADDAEETFDLIISTNNATPTGPAHYRQLGWFETNSTASPVQIKQGSAYNLMLTSRQLQVASGEYTGNGTLPRTIYTGFRPVVIDIVSSWYENGWQGGHWMILPTSTHPWLPTGVTFQNDGFVVTVDSMNHNNAPVQWVAWGY